MAISGTASRLGTSASTPCARKCLKPPWAMPANRHQLTVRGHHRFLRSVRDSTKRRAPQALQAPRTWVRASTRGFWPRPAGARQGGGGSSGGSIGKRRSAWRSSENCCFVQYPSRRGNVSSTGARVGCIAYNLDSGVTTPLAMIDKIVPSAAAALAHVPDGATVMIGAGRVRKITCSFPSHADHADYALIRAWRPLGQPSTAWSPATSGP